MNQLLQELHTLIQDEQLAARQQLLLVWQKPLPEKLHQGLTQDFTHVDLGPEPGTLLAYPGEAESRFREGDLLCLHTGDPLEPLGRSFTFEMETEEAWLLRGSATLAWTAYSGGRCYADPDTMDLSGYYFQALEDVAHSAIGRDTLLPLLQGRAEVAFDEADVAEGEATARAQGCNERQAEAVGLAHGATLLACIQGPPGTGKTRVLALIARLGVARGERILLTSHTHMAINNALNRIHREGVPAVKVGRTTQRRGLDAAIENFEGLDDWEARPTNGYVVGATAFATCTNRLDHFEFDTILFDEASQITPPLALMAMRKGRRYLFIGDQKQLPPVLLSRSVMDKETHSIFARLIAQEADHKVMLSETFRMNQALTNWPSRTFYAGELAAAPPNRDRRLPWPRSLGLQNASAPMARVLDPNHPQVFIPNRSPQARSRNQTEALLVADIITAAQAAGLALEELGIVTPFRAQGRAIRRLLRERLGLAQSQRVVADTVERMQGQERELVILSLAVGDVTYLEAVSEFFFQPQRLNVSITRSKTKLIVLGPDIPPPAPGPHETLRGWVETYRDFIAQCRRVEV